tara:strand:- start:7338 stop:7601 length:264 start_codon:yes stop_codon:yes gene_type:complete
MVIEMINEAITLPDQCFEVSLPKGEDCLWITVGNISVYIKRTDEGVVVDLFPLGQETGTSMATTYAFFQEAEISIEEERSYDENVEQ